MNSRPGRRRASLTSRSRPPWDAGRQRLESGAEQLHQLGRHTRRLAAEMPARRVPSTQECSFCHITAEDCPDRTWDGPREAGTSEGFSAPESRHPASRRCKGRKPPEAVAKIKTRFLKPHANGRRRRGDTKHPHFSLRRDRQTAVSPVPTSRGRPPRFPTS